eukprot:TRINITY_DN6971_c5_g1_i1.p1 TRINITY_DN6971_c5_g1~~TRINITY_DN6971_c5_g1_i1.p1  ORF type:complete len:184 (-),score=51.21 TRINITY_DN6971_c5_g1_i1:112-663(-)
MAKIERVGKIGAYTLEDIKDKFLDLDEDADGGLTQDEFIDMLRRGRPDFTDEELDCLYKKLDCDKNGKVDFDEFVDFIFDSYSDSADWDSVRSLFDAYAASDKADKVLGFKEIKAMCESLDWFEPGFDDKHLHIIYEKKQKKKDGGLTWSEFKRVVKCIAKKKKIEKETLYKWLSVAGGANLR